MKDKKDIILTKEDKTDLKKWMFIFWVTQLLAMFWFIKFSKQQLVATQNKNTKEEFHAVEFMRTVRAEMSAEYEKDPKAYFKRLKKVMENFKRSLNNQTTQKRELK